MKVAVIVVLATAVVIAAVVALGALRWEAGAQALRRRLETARAPLVPQRVDFRELDGLPAPAQRYFRTVLRDGQPIIAAAGVRHTGTFNMSETAEHWRHFESTQRVITRPPGFVWDARIRMAPGVTIFVHDAYAAGEGSLVAKLLGLVTVMQHPRTPELAHGELMRFLAEAAWYPTALLPSQGARWQAVDDTRASVTLTDGRTTVTLVIAFDAQGLISTVRADGRHRLVDGAQTVTPWQGRFWNYQKHGGMLVPLDGEVAWLLADGPTPYWRGHIGEITYEFAR